MMSVTFASKCGSFESLKGACQMRLETSFSPDALNAPVAEPHGFRNLSRAPMRHDGRFLGRCFLDHGKLGLPAQWGLSRRASLVPLEALDTFIHVAFLPTPHGRLRPAGPAHDSIRAEPISHRWDDLGSPHELAGTFAIHDDRFELSSVRGTHVRADIISSHSRICSTMGIICQRQNIELP